jgi:hypothetical protein
MNHEQYIGDPRLNGNGPHRVPALLAGLVHTVQADQPILILKDQRGQFE